MRLHCFLGVLVFVVEFQLRWGALCCCAALYCDRLDAVGCCAGMYTVNLFPVSVACTSLPPPRACSAYITSCCRQCCLLLPLARLPHLPTRLWALLCSFRILASSYSWANIFLRFLRVLVHLSRFFFVRQSSYLFSLCFVIMCVALCCVFCSFVWLCYGGYGLLCNRRLLILRNSPPPTIHHPPPAQLVKRSSARPTMADAPFALSVSSLCLCLCLCLSLSLSVSVSVGALR